MQRVARVVLPVYVTYTYHLNFDMQCLARLVLSVYVTYYQDFANVLAVRRARQIVSLCHPISES